METFNVIVALMVTESATLKPLMVGADDGERIESGVMRMNKVKMMLETVERELRQEKLYSAADMLLPIIKEVKKYESCEGCTDRVIEPRNCHDTCRGNLYRHMLTAEQKKRRKEDQIFDSFKNQAIRDTKAKVRR